MSKPLTVQDVKRLAPQAQADFKQLLRFLIYALSELQEVAKSPEHTIPSAALRRITGNVQDAFINIDTLRAFTAEVCDLVSDETTQHQAAQEDAYLLGWKARMADILDQFSGDEYADVRRQLEQIAEE